MATLPAIVVSANSHIIIDGHHRYSVIKALGGERCPCLLVDYHSNDIVLVASPSSEGDTVTTTDKDDVIAAATSRHLLTPKSSKHMIQDENGDLHPIEVLSPVVRLLTPPPVDTPHQQGIPKVLEENICEKSERKYEPEETKTAMPSAPPMLQDRPVEQASSSKMLTPSDLRSLYHVDELPCYLTYPRAPPRPCGPSSGIGGQHLSIEEQINLASLLTHIRSPEPTVPSLHRRLVDVFADLSVCDTVSVF